MNRSGFTLLEVLVASVLMGMLVTILTVIFNQSAIAWRTGKATVADMTVTERNLARIHAAADSALPYTRNGNYFVTSPWNDMDSDDSSKFHGRGIATAGDIRKGFDSVAGGVPFYNDRGGDSGWLRSGLGGTETERFGQFIVGVRSAGPDRVFDTEDDITTWPEEVE